MGRNVGSGVDAGVGRRSIPVRAAGYRRHAERVCVAGRIPDSAC